MSGCLVRGLCPVLAREKGECFNRFYKASINDTPGAKQKAFVRAVLKLQEAKLIGVWSDKVWLAGRVK